MSYDITTHLVHLTANGDTSITTTATVTLTPDADYVLPDNITVSNATYVYTKSTGVILISQPTGTVTITACARKEIDITTLAGYEDLFPGYHILSIVAKASDYLDSEPSEPIAFYKLVTPTEESTAGDYFYDFLASDRASAYQIYAEDENGVIYIVGEINNYEYDRIGVEVIIYNAPFEVLDDVLRIV